MADITIYNEEGFGQCSECEVHYLVVFNRNAIYSRMEFCPFCGSEIDEIKDESEARDD